MDKSYDIVLKNVNKTINGSEILRDINLNFESGKIYGLHGTNGSGKTMLLRMIAGLIKPDIGEVWVCGKKLHVDVDFPESIGVIIENPDFWKHYTGAEVLWTLASIKKIVTKDEVKAAMRRIGLKWEDKRTIKKYSLGMKQRLAIAQAIMEHPKIILLDEPTNALDDNGVKQVEQIIKEEVSRGAVVIMASHNIRDLNFCDELIHVDKGCVK